MEEGPEQLSHRRQRETEEVLEKTAQRVLGHNTYSRHVPLVPEFDISLGVKALAPKFPWKTHPSVTVASVPRPPPLGLCV